MMRRVRQLRLSRISVVFFAPQTRNERPLTKRGTDFAPPRVLFQGAFPWLPPFFSMVSPRSFASRRRPVGRTRKCPRRLRCRIARGIRWCHRFLMARKGNFGRMSQAVHLVTWLEKAIGAEGQDDFACRTKADRTRAPRAHDLGGFAELHLASVLS